MAPHRLWAGVQLKFAPVLLLWSGAVYAAGVPVLPPITPTPSGGVYSAYPDGDDGSAAIPLVTTQPGNVSVFNGASGSLDMADYLEQPGSPDATITPNCSPSLPSGGFSFSGTTFSWSATTTSSITCQPSAERSGFTVVWQPITFTSVAAPVSDTTAPNGVFGITTTPASGAVLVSGRCPIDPYDGEPGALDRVEVRLNGSGVQNVTSCGTGLSPEYTLSDPDSRSPTHSLDDGRDFTFSFTGGSSGTLGQAPVWSSAAVTGLAWVGATFTSLTNSADYGTCVIGASAGANYTSNSFGAGVRRVGSQYQAWVWSRTAGGSTVPLYSANISGLPYTIIVDETSSGVWAVYGGTDPNTLSVLGAAPTTTYTHTVATAKQWGYGAASGVGSGATIACEGDNLTVNDQKTWSYSYTTGSGGNFTARAVDSEGNNGATSAAVAGVPTSAPTSNLDYEFTFEGVTAGTVADEADLIAKTGLKYSRKQGTTTILSSGCAVGDRCIRLSVTGAGSRREEIYPTGDVTVHGGSSNCMNGRAGCDIEDKEVWDGAWVRIVSHTPTNANPVIYQLQQLGDGSTACDDANQPYMSLILKATIDVEQKKWGTQTTGVSPGGTCLSGTVFDRTQVFASFSGQGPGAACSFPENTWYREVKRFRFNANGNGRVTVWINEVQCYDFSTGPLGFETFPDGSFRWHSLAKRGPYHWHTGVNGTYTIDYDDIRTTIPLTNGTGSYADVMPGYSP